MKTLVSIIAIFLSIAPATFSQTKAHSNHMEVSAELEYGSTIISWEAFKEVNTSYFLIEKSIDGENYSTIGQQIAAGSSNGITNYTFEDLSVDSSIVQYRITLICMDGTTFASNVTSSYPSNIAQVEND